MWKVVGIGLLLLAGQASGSEAVGCKAHLQAVNDQLVFAKAHNNAGQTAGLEQAARNIKANCTDEGLLKEQKERVHKLRGEVDERLLELQEARVSGKPEKIAKQQAKLEESQTKMLEAQRELDQQIRLVGK
ncbi:DUF1090 domain-containing protein [Aeromonas sobria]|uniref:DUF1090 domain-containing protein n=1 Tax=Aeromonas sobria TaxID=646 RepID=A0A1S2CP00_AERSO|nr:DUF1090 domain-containing protein [Aeromonas sobria]MBS4686376.1 DUF1090 domain-containing protein [Aeromonas sobria]OHY89859.1 hypothetical protein BJD16_05855 [Aeromonas sobria]